MKKVTFSIRKRNGDKITGVGYITDEDMLIPALSKTGKPYIRVIEDCVKSCHKTDEDIYQGYHEFFMECDLTDDNGKITTRELPITYYIWYKILTD